MYKLLVYFELRINVENFEILTLIFKFHFKIKLIWKNHWKVKILNSLNKF